MSNERVPPESARRDELLERAYNYVLQYGITGLTLRPLAKEIDSSPRVLLFLFGSKNGLVRALLGRARVDELAWLRRLEESNPGGDLASMAARIWEWLSAEEHRDLLRLWPEGYTRSLVEPHGPWANFAQSTVSDWLELLAAAQDPDERSSPRAIAERTLTLAVLRGALLDLLATNDQQRITAAVEQYLTDQCRGSASPGKLRVAWIV